MTDKEIPSFMISQGDHAMKTGELSLTTSGTGGKSCCSEQIAQAFAGGSNDFLFYNNPYNCENESDLHEAYDRGYNSVWAYWK